MYWIEFLTIAGVHLLAVASPGPDFAVVVKHSVQYGRRAAIITSIGVGFAILLHVIYSLLGLGLMLKTSPIVFQIFIYAAAGYLFYLGWTSVRSKAPKKQGQNSEMVKQPNISDSKAFGIGFLTNGLNPKATLFFLTLFVGIVSIETPNEIKALYGLYLAVATGVWFCTLSFFLSTSKVRNLITSKGYWFDRFMGAVLILLAIKLVIPV